MHWYAGWDSDLQTRPHQVVVAAEESGRDGERFRRDVGAGTVTAMSATTTGLFLAVETPRHTGTGAVEKVLASDAVDITGRCWPLPAEPVDADDYTAGWAARFTGLDDVWVDQQGRHHPLVRGLHDSEVAVVGNWPDTSLHITFDWDWRPTSRLRRIVPLFDELGRQVPPEYADIHLMEDLETGAVPPAPDLPADYLDL